VDVTKPIDAAANSDWPLERARAYLKTGMSVPETERRLVALGLSPAAAQAVVTEVLEEKVSEKSDEPQPPPRRLRWHRTLSAVVGLGCILLGFRVGGVSLAARTAVPVVFLLVLIWFANQKWFSWSRFAREWSEKRSQTPAFVFRLVAWVVLVAYAFGLFAVVLSTR
jgi:hypothetical protein